MKRRIKLGALAREMQAAELAAAAAGSLPRLESKLANAERLLKKALTREKRAKTLRRVWSRRVRYYQRKVAAAKSVAVEVQQ